MNRHRVLGSGGVLTMAACLTAVAGISTSGTAAFGADASVAPVGPPVTLRMGDAEPDTAPSQAWIEKFVTDVARESGGAITIEPLYKAGGDIADREPAVARRVMSGDLEMGLIPVRTWNDVGITSLQALQAPFGIDNDALLTAVAADPLVDPLLAGMQDHGVVGLSLWPDDLRHLFGYERAGGAILSPADLQGARIWSLKSDLQSMILEGLGAVPEHAFDTLDAEVRNGTLRGAESSFSAIGSVAGPATGTADLAIYPKYMVLVAEDSAFSRLSEAQRAVIRQAATDARDAAIAGHVPDASRARQACIDGSIVVLAGAANVEAFRAAARPIVEQLAQDPTTATALRQIDALRQTVTPSPPGSACVPVVNPMDPWPSAAPGPTLTLIPDGIYVHTVTEDALLAAGVDPGDAHNNAGKWTMTVNGDMGTWAVDEPWGGHGSVDVKFELMDDRVRFQQVGSPSYWDMRWQLQGDQLVLAVVGSDWNTAQGWVSLNAYWAGNWTKIE